MTAAAAAAPVSCRMAVSSSSSSSRDPLLRRGSVCQLRGSASQLRGSASQLRGSATTTTMGLELQQGSLCLSISFLSSLLSAESRYSSKHLLHDAHHLDNTSSSGASVVAIDNKIEQAMDLVKSHLMFAVREEVEVLKEQIKELIEKNSQLEQENNLLKTLASPEQMAQFQTQVLQSGVTPPAPPGGPTPSSTQQGAGSSAAPITAAAAAPVPLPTQQQQQQQPGVSYTSA